jgi:tail tape measure protein, TP901 family
MGITVEIGGDTTKLQTAIKSVNGQIKSTQQQLKDVDKLLKLDLGNTELLERQMSDVAESM